MKEFATFIIFLILGYTLVFTNPNANAEAVDHVPGVVIEVDDEEGVIFVETRDGNVWGFYGEGYSVGETLILVFVGEEIVDAYTANTIIFEEVIV